MRLQAAKRIFFYLYSDAHYSLKFPDGVVPPYFLAHLRRNDVISARNWLSILALLTFTLFILTSLMIGHEFPSFILLSPSSISTSIIGDRRGAIPSDCFVKQQRTLTPVCYEQ